MPALAEQAWRAVPFRHVVLAFLRAEWDRHKAITKWVDRRLISEPDPADAAQSALREAVLRCVRGPLLRHLPADTHWFEVRLLQDEHLSELRVIGGYEWDDAADANELLKVAVRRPRPLHVLPDAWESPILWGHARSGPFTILEGNNRLTGYACSARAGLSVPCYIGISEKPAYWHRPDHLHRVR